MEGLPCPSTSFRYQLASTESFTGCEYDESEGLLWALSGSWIVNTEGPLFMVFIIKYK